jgi:hypothetical protein
VFVLAVALVAPVPSFTVHTTVYVPAEVNDGVPVIVAVRGEGPAACAVNVNDTGIPACVIVRLFAASGSVAEAVIVAIAVPSDPEADEGAVIDGVKFGASGAPTPSESYQSVGIPLMAPHGSARSPRRYVFPNTKAGHPVPNAVPKLFGSNGRFGYRGKVMAGDPLVIVTGIFPTESSPGLLNEPAGCLWKVNSTS